MNKKLLLLALPALMVMSACTYMQSATNFNDFNIIKEDTLAHEEIFGGVDKLQPMRLGDPGETPEAGSGFAIAPKVGVQFFPYTKDEADLLAVRFVAAIGGLDGGITASWTRAVSSNSGSELKAETGGYNSTVEYASLNSGGSPKAATSEGTGYNKYVVYTMYDIPAAQSKSYIAAYLKLSKEGESDIYSKAVAARIDGKNTFSFEYNKQGFFLAGKIDTNANRVANQDVDTKEDYDGQNAASFTSYLSANDKFVVVQKETSLFKVWSGACLKNGDAEKASNVDEMITVSSSRRYVIYLNDSNELYQASFGYTATDVYLRGPAAGSAGDNGWGDASESARFYDDVENQGFLRYTFAESEVGKSFKIAHKSAWDWDVGYYNELHGDAKNGVHLTNDASYNIKLLIAGTYDFYVNSGNVWVYFVR